MRIKLQQFEGPLDLLLQLIEEEKLDIIKLDLAKIADQYLGLVNQMQDKFRHASLNLDKLTDYLVVAAQLILIKSKAILPSLELTEEEEESIEDLQRRLIEYKKFKDAAKRFRILIESGKHCYDRNVNLEEERVFCPPSNFKIGNLQKVFENILQTIPTEAILGTEVVEEVVSIEEKINFIKDAIQKTASLDFSALSKKTNSKTDIIVTFLALLELVKQRTIKAEQNGVFGEIKVEQNNV